MTVILAADHGGFADKKRASQWLAARGIEFLDAGALEFDQDDDYPVFVHAAVKLQREHPNAKMILWCRSGAGVCLAANRYPGVFCGLALSHEQVKAATADDHLNALAIAADYTWPELQLEYIDVFLHTSPAPEARHERRRRLVDQLPKEL